MAVKKPDPQIHDYWQRYWQSTLFLTVSMQIIAVLIVGIALMLFRIVEPDEAIFWITLIAVLVAVVGINVIVETIVTEPFKQLIAAHAQVAGERLPFHPPNPNAPRYEKSGLRPILLAIYESALKEHSLSQPSNTSEQDQEAHTVKATLEQSSVGIALLDSDQKVVFANNAVPLTRTDTSQSLDLLFGTEMSLDAWIQECEEKSVHAQKTWMRIPSKPMGEDGRRVYDIAASYSKEGAVPVSLVLIEKTAEYKPEDDDLNFIAFAAHELRGPITVIRGYLDSLNDELAEKMDDEQKELFTRLIVSSNRLDSYINNILNSSRYDRRHFTVRLTEASIADIYHTIDDDMQLRASSQRRLLHVDLPANLPTVAADMSSIGEVLGNLIDNAIKYSNEGGVVEVRAEQKGDSLEIEVEDHGIGMPANVVGNLFHKFYRSHRSRETVAGTGIGLYISKAIVESHGGQMHARSVEGEGSTFSFTLPLYSAVADKIVAANGDNRTLISNHSGSWIKNHGSIRG